MSVMQCGLCCSQLGEPVVLWGVKKIVCNNCLGFIMRWSIECEALKPKPSEWAMHMGKAIRYMAHDKECACMGNEEADCDCGHIGAFDEVMKFIEQHKEVAMPGGAK